MADRTGVIWIKSGSTNIAKITVTQQEGAVKYFYFDDGSTSATTKELNALSGDTSVTCQYVTSYDGLTTATTSTWITGATLNNGTLTVNFTANPDSSVRTGTMYVKNGDETVGTLTITQAKKMFFLWSNNTSAITQTIAATTTTGSASYTTNYTGLTVESAASYTWITSKTLSNPSGNGTFGITAQTNDTLSARTATFNIKNGSTIVGTISLQQGTGSPYFYVGKSVAAAAGTAVTVTCASADTQEEGAVFAETVFYRTNLYEWATGATNLTLVKEPTAMFKDSGTWINDSNSVRATDPNGVQTTFFVQIYCYDNTGAPRTGTLTVKSGSTVLSTITVEQEGVAAPYVHVSDVSYGDAVESACTASTDVSKDGGSGGFYCVTNCSAAEINTFTLSADSDFTSCSIYSISNGMFRVYWALDENDSHTLGKYIYIKSGSTVMAKMTVYQEYVNANGWIDGVPAYVPRNGGSYTIEVGISDDSFPELSQDVPWTISWGHDDPVSCSPQSGYGDTANITLTYGPNTQGSHTSIYLYAVGPYGTIELFSDFSRWE